MAFLGQVHLQGITDALFIIDDKNSQTHSYSINKKSLFSDKRKDPSADSLARWLFGNPAVPEGPVALRPGVASGLPLSEHIIST